MELDKLEKFYGLHSKVYDLTRPFFLFSRERALSMLDLACGTGLNIPYIARVINEENITGIDYSESMLARAKTKFPNIRFIQGDISNYKFEETFDKIICTYSLSMVESWQETIQNVRKYLSRNGTFLILDFHPWDGAMKPLYPMFKYWLKMHGVDPNRDYLLELRRDFKDVEKEVINLGYNQILTAKSPHN